MAWQSFQSGTMRLEHPMDWEVTERAGPAGNQILVAFPEGKGWLMVTLVNDRQKSDADAVSKELVHTLIDKLGMSNKSLQRMDSGQFYGYPGASYLAQQVIKDRTVEIRAQGRSYKKDLVIITSLDTTEGVHLATIQRILRSIHIEKDRLFPTI